jgi:hypothetical protein
MDAPYSYAKVSAWLDLNGKRVPVVRAAVNYEVNALPTALVTLPLGRNAYTGEPSPVHTILDISEPTPVKLYVSLTPRFGVAKPFGIPEGAFVLFEGYTAGKGYRKSSQPPMAEFTLGLRHWLSELDYSSVFSQYSHPNNPADYSANAIFPVAGANAGGAPGKGNMYGPYDVNGALDVKNVTKDLWTDTLKKFYLGLCKTEGLKIGEQKGWKPEAPPPVDEETGVRPLSNEIASAALARIKSHPSLKIRLGGQDNLAQMITKDLKALAERKDELASHTIWGSVMANCASEYMFSIIPRVSDALVVPYVATSRKSGITITPDEYYSADIPQGDIPRPIRAFGILSGMNSLANADGLPNTDPEIGRMKVGGWYEVKDRKLGVVRIEAPPRWAAGCLGEFEYAGTSAGAKNKTVATAEHPDAAGPPSKSTRKARARKAKSVASFLVRYARTRLAYEQFVGCQGTFSGPLRMDVAPGTCVELVTSTDPFLEYDALKTSFFGSILRLSTVIDAESRMVATSFHLGHVRTQRENAVEANALDYHPLFEDVFVGAPLHEI